MDNKKIEVKNFSEFECEKYSSLFDSDAYQKFSKWNEIIENFAYNSNAIEKNRLSLSQMKIVLAGGKINEISQREHIEAENQMDGIRFIEELAKENNQVTEWDIKNIHALVLNNIGEGSEGQYRRKNVLIAGASTVPPSFMHLNEEMKSLIEWYNSKSEKNEIEKIAELHTRFVEIHPFADGNGRTGRLLMNLELMKCGYLPSIIRVEDDLRYYDALNIACISKDYQKITEMVSAGISYSQSLLTS